MTTKLKEQIAHCATYCSLTIELLKDPDRENYSVLGYVNIKQKNGEMLIHLIFEQRYIISRNHAYHIFSELRRDWNMDDDN